MATTVLGLKTFTASDPVDYNEVNDNYTKIDNGVKTAMQGRAAHNILDNSDFSIAQAGKNGLHGSTKYVCDRWISWSADATFGNGYITPGSPIDQRFYLSNEQANKTHTVVLYMADGTVKYHVGKPIDAFGSYSTVYCGVSDAATNRYMVRIGTGQNVKSVALYEGSYTADTLPAYVPKDNELAECMRYYYRSNDSNSGQDGMIIRRAINAGNNAKSYSLESVDLPVPMRITPTITVFDGYGNKNYVQEWYSNDQVGNISIRYANNRSFCVASESAAFIGGKSYYFNYEVSADL